MLDPYRMVVVNLASSFILLGGILIYKFIFPKKKINLFVLLIIISLLPLISLLRAGTYESGDFNIHVRRTIEFFKLLREGIIMPTWAGDFNGTYGYPIFGFNYTLPYYITSLIHILGFSFITSLKIFLGINFILSGVFMYIFSRNLFKNTLAAFSASIFYLFNPYHLIITHFKIPIGEILAYTFIPLVFYFINKFLYKKQIVYLLLSGLMLGIVVLSHIVIAIFLAPVIFLYIYLHDKKLDKALIYYFSILLVGALVSVYQWSASIIYKPYLFLTSYPQDPLSLLYSPTIAELLYSTWRFGLLFQGPRGETAYLLGYAQIIAIILIIFLSLKNKIDKKYKHILIFCSLGFLFTLFLMSPLSKIVWYNFPPVNGPLSQRLLLLVSLYTSLLVGYLVFVTKKNVVIIYLIIGISIWSTALNWGQRRVIPEINDSVLAKDIPFGLKWGDTHFYANSRWVDPNNQWFSEVPKDRLDIVSGEANVENVSRSSTKHVYNINAETGIVARENTLYFPGWTVKDNGKLISISPDKKGIITFSLSKGKHNVSLMFEDLSYFLIAKLISALSVFFILIYALLFFFKRIFISARKIK